MPSLFWSVSAGKPVEFVGDVVDRHFPVPPNVRLRMPGPWKSSGIDYSGKGRVYLFKGSAIKHIYLFTELGWLDDLESAIDELRQKRCSLFLRKKQINWKGDGFHEYCERRLTTKLQATYLHVFLCLVTVVNPRRACRIFDDRSS